VAPVTTPEPLRPRYGGASVERIVPALTGRTDRSWLPEPARDATTVLLLVLDGLGWELLRAHADDLPELDALTGGPITTVAPSTTAAALTSITTGLPPIEHGVLGFRVRIDGAVLNVLRWTVDTGPVPDPFRVQRHPPFLGREVPVVTRREFRTSGFTAAHLRDVPFHGWTTPAVLVEQCRVLAAARVPTVYAYYPGVDTVAHEFGLCDGYLARELLATDRLVGALLDVLPGDAALLVTADHGEVHVEEWHDLAPVASLVRGCSGEGRFRWLTAPRGGATELAAALRSEFGHLAWVMTREEVVDGGWLGPGPAPAANLRRLGDVALLPHAPVGFVDPAMPGERRLVGAHGSLTPAEVLVPLLAGRGRAS
jgi:hypothetical protein